MNGQTVKAKGSGLEMAASVDNSFGLERKRPRSRFQAATGTVALQSIPNFEIRPVSKEKAQSVDSAPREQLRGYLS
jgi:hypothetical protein